MGLKATGYDLDEFEKEALDLKNNIYSLSFENGEPENISANRLILFWTKEDVSSFLNYSRLDPFHDLYVTTLNTGMRLSEVLGLCWDKIDFENNQIAVSRCLRRTGLKETTKTHEARFIPLNVNVKAILEKLSKSKIIDSFVF